MGKLRNLLREFKKGKHQDRGSRLANISYFKEIDGALRERSKTVWYCLWLMPICNFWINMTGFYLFCGDIFGRIGNG